MNKIIEEAKKILELDEGQWDTNHSAIERERSRFILEMASFIKEISPSWLPTGFRIKRQKLIKDLGKNGNNK